MKRSTIVALLAAAVFIAIYIARLIFIMTTPEENRPNGQQSVFYMDNNEALEQTSSSDQWRVYKNYASAKVVIEQPLVGSQIVDQKYEQVASLFSTTTAFDEDRVRIAEAIKASNALVQREVANGLSGSRVLFLSIGVVPGVFDSTVEALRAIGDLENVGVTKEDRTADYSALEARRRSLEKTRASLAALRSAGAALADRVELESKLLEIEGQIQDLGVSLGDFSETNSFCTVNMTLTERSAVASPAFAKAAFEALAWSAVVYIELALAVLAILAASALLAWLIGKYRELSRQKQ